MKKRNTECWYKDVCTLQCTSSCIRFLEMKQLIDSSNIPTSQQTPKKLRPTTENDAKQFLALQKIKDNIVRFVSGGKNLYICSQSAGTAKTSWAIKLMLKYFDCVWSGNGLQTRGIFVHTPTLLQQLKDFDHPLSHAYIEALKTCDLVIWDDIATSSKLSDYDYNQLLILIDSRILANKSNIFTSNVVKKEDLSLVIGARLSSRIFDTSKIITFDSKDYRRRMSADD